MKRHISYKYYYDVLFVQEIFERENRSAALVMCTYSLLTFMVCPFRDLYSFMDCICMHLGKRVFQRARMRNYQTV